MSVRPKQSNSHKKVCRKCAQKYRVSAENIVKIYRGIWKRDLWISKIYLFCWARWTFSLVEKSRKTHWKKQKSSPRNKKKERHSFIVKYGFVIKEGIKKIQSLEINFGWLFLPHLIWKCFYDFLLAKMIWVWPKSKCILKSLTDYSKTIG